jgi:hypothetical protein
MDVCHYYYDYDRFDPLLLKIYNHPYKLSCKQVILSKNESLI